MVVLTLLTAPRIHSACLRLHRASTFILLVVCVCDVGVGFLAASFIALKASSLLGSGVILIGLVALQGGSIPWTSLALALAILLESDLGMHLLFVSLLCIILIVICCVHIGPVLIAYLSISIPLTAILLLETSCSLTFVAALVLYVHIPLTLFIAVLVLSQIHRSNIASVVLFQWVVKLYLLLSISYSLMDSNVLTL